MWQTVVLSKVLGCSRIVQKMTSQVFSKQKRCEGQFVREDPTALTQGITVVFVNSADDQLPDIRLSSLYLMLKRIRKEALKYLFLPFRDSTISYHGCHLNTLASFHAVRNFPQPKKTIRPRLLSSVGLQLSSCFNNTELDPTCAIQEMQNICLHSSKVLASENSLMLSPASYLSLLRQFLLHIFFL